MYAKKNYTGVELFDGGKNSLELGDAAARLAFVYMRMGKLEGIEEYLRLALKIREEKLGHSHVGVAHSYLQLADLYDRMGRYGDEIESFLQRASEIFLIVHGKDSNEANGTLAQLKNVRSKRSDVVSPQSILKMRSGSSSDDELEYRVVEESKTQNLKESTKPKMSLDEELAALTLDDDPNTRMVKAGEYFKKGMFTVAEKLISDAYETFLENKGPDDEQTKVAKQNLFVARANAMNRLWMEVVTEEILDSGMQSLETSKDGTLSEVEKNISSEDAEDFADYKKLMTENAFDSLDSTTNKDSTCIVQ